MVSVSVKMTETYPLPGQPPWDPRVGGRGHQPSGVTGDSIKSLAGILGSISLQLSDINGLRDFPAQEELGETDLPR